MESESFNNNVNEDDDEESNLIEDLTSNLLKTQDTLSNFFVEKITDFFKKNGNEKSIDQLKIKNTIEQIVDKAFVKIIMQIQDGINNKDFYLKSKKLTPK
jgi:hypothetical protein